jgi:hypothetical protein
MSARKFATAGQQTVYRLAYAISGQSPPLIKTGNRLNRLEYDSDSP